MPIQWSKSMRVHEIVELQLGISLDKSITYVLSFSVEGNQAWLNWFDGNGERVSGMQAPDTLPLAQQAYLQKLAELYDLQGNAE